MADDSPLGLDDPGWCLALSRVPGLNARVLEMLLGAYGTAETAWGASEASLAETLAAHPRVRSALLEARRRLEPRRLADEAARAGCRVVAWGHAGYPTRLQGISGAPIVLFVRGRVECLERPSIAVVGTRRASEYGLKAADLFAGDLARAGLCVVSGMARGIDEAAHRAALAAEGGTVAVLGCGADVCYPPESATLKRAIEERGAVVSQFPPGAPPLKGHFPVRNRVMCGLALGVLVVEAPARSGAMTTAEHAIELERPLFAVPGSVFRSSLDGCHRLLTEGVAGLASRPQDVLEGIGWREPRPWPDFRSGGERRPPGGLDEEAARVWAVLEAQEREPSADDEVALEVEEIIRRSGMASPNVVRSLARMELEGLLERRPGNLYALARPGGATRRR